MACAVALLFVLQGAALHQNNEEHLVKPVVTLRLTDSFSEQEEDQRDETTTARPPELRGIRDDISVPTESLTEQACLAPPADETTCAPPLWSITMPPVFGPLVWPALHLVAARYPDSPAAEQREDARRFLQALPFMLPCGYCGAHLFEYVNATDLTEVTQSAASLSAFFVGAHNNVTASVNQANVSDARGPKKLWTAEEARQSYTCAGSCAADSRIWTALHVMAAGFHTPGGSDRDGPAGPVLRFHAERFLHALPSLLPCAACGTRLRALLDGRNLTAAVATKAALTELVVDATNDATEYARGSGAGAADGLPPPDLLTAGGLRAKYFCMQPCVLDKREWIEEGKELFAWVAANPAAYM